jgi:hypothetical protein
MVMKPMIWHPEPKDKKVNEYLDKINREPWIAIWVGIILFISLFTLLILLGAF